MRKKFRNIIFCKTCNYNVLLNLDFFYFFKLVKTPRFTTTRVDEAEHAASVGIPFVPRVCSDLQDVTRNLSTTSDSDGASTSFLAYGKSPKSKSISCDFSDSNVNVTNSTSDKSSVTHGFNIDKKD